MGKKLKEIRELENKIRLEEVGLMLTKRAANGHVDGSDLRKLFDDQLIRIKRRIKELKLKLAQKKGSK